jgi:hypothetical protein
LTVGYFSSFWGFLSFLVILPPLFMILPGIFRLVNDALQPIASARVGAPIALLNTMIIAFYVFSLRDALRHYTLTRHFKKKPGYSLSAYALLFFVVAILLTFVLAFDVTAKNSIIGSPEYSASEIEGLIEFGSPMHLLIKLAMTGLLIFIFVFFSLSAGTMAAYEYTKYVDAHYPDPIYLNEHRLQEVVLDTVKTELGPDVTLNIAGMERLEDAGIGLDLRHAGKLASAEGVHLLEEKSWRVEANRWGRVMKVQQQGARTIQLAPQDEG